MDVNHYQVYALIIIQINVLIVIFVYFQMENVEIKYVLIILELLVKQIVKILLVVKNV